MWSYGVQVVEPAFTGGLRRAALQQAWAQYRQYADAYRGSILSAFQDVEDGLSQTRLYDRQTKQQYEAVSAALRTQRMTMALYTGGLTNYLDVVVAQQAALTARIAAVQAQTSAASGHCAADPRPGWQLDAAEPADNEADRPDPSLAI